MTIQIKRKPRNPITKIRSGHGDSGTTFFQGEMIWKNSPVIEFLGGIDEACAALSKIDFDETLYSEWRVGDSVKLESETFMHKSKVILFDIGGLVYTNKKTFDKHIHLLDDYVKYTSEYMKHILEQATFTKLDGFIVPTKVNSDAMWARSVIRKCEGLAVTANFLWAIPSLNIMSDFVFMVSWYQGVDYQWTGFTEDG